MPDNQSFNPQDSMKTIDQMMSKIKDDEMWRKAKSRAAFKWSLTVYIIVNSFLVAIWYYTVWEAGHIIYFWPFWPMLGWGIGLLVQYLHAYRDTDMFSVEKEYERLKNQNKQ
jgi:2TM domain